jgi:calpain-15
LIEKAFAKLCGSYEALDGGHITEGLSVLTGYPCEKIKLKSSHRDIEQELIWGQLLSFKESKFPMAVSSSPVDGVPEHVQNTNELGIHLFHAYSLLDIQQIGTERLVLLRDPWGHTTYKGIGHQWLESEEGTFWIAGKDLFK